MKHSHRWLMTLLAGLDESVDAKTTARILEGCGRTCISRSLLAKSRAAGRKSKNTEEFLTRLAGFYRHLKRSGRRVYVEYPQCYCPLVRGFPGRLPESFCNCSRGWVKELFETGLGRRVEVVLEKSIRQGDDICRFRVKLQGRAGSLPGPDAQIPR